MCVYLVSNVVLPGLAGFSTLIARKAFETGPSLHRVKVTTAEFIAFFCRGMREGFKFLKTIRKPSFMLDMTPDTIQTLPVNTES